MSRPDKDIQYYNYFIPYHPFRRAASDIRYLPVTNYLICQDANMGDVITLFGRDINGRISKVGLCTVRGKLIKYSKIAVEEQKFCTDTYCWQLPVKLVEAQGCYFDSQLMQYCGCYHGNIPFRPRKITRALWYGHDRKYDIYESFWYVWKYCYDKEIIEQYRQLVVHLYRDKMMDEKSHYHLFLNQHNHQCSICGMAYSRSMIGSNHFFELHDTETDIMHPFRKLNQDKYIVVCPSCHKKLHFEMIPENITENDNWYGDYHFNFYDTTTIWNEFFCKEFNESVTVE